jgi:hypothetical protein
MQTRHRTENGTTGGTGPGALDAVMGRAGALTEESPFDNPIPAES